MSLLLETKRLRLRPFQDDDLHDFAAYRDDTAVARYQSWETPYTLAQAYLLVEHMKQATPGVPGEWYQVAIERRADGALLGDCAFCIDENGRQAEIGYTLATAHQGQGYASEAVRRLLDYLFGEHKLHRVQANCDVENTASARLLERLGIRREAHFVQNDWFKGRWSSTYGYAILRSEWKARETAVAATIKHVAIWTPNLERLRHFYQTYFAAQANDKYTNPRKQFSSYFLTFPGGSTRLELMAKPDMAAGDDTLQAGYAHVAIGVGSVTAVDTLTAQLKQDGFTIVDHPRRTGDGYYESVVLDPDGNRVEITI